MAGRTNATAELHRRPFLMVYWLRPKPTVWTNANALWAGKSMSMHLRLRREDITLIYMPLFHANAQISLKFCPLTSFIVK